MHSIRQVSCFETVAILFSCIASFCFVSAQSTAELEHILTRAQKGYVDDELKLAYAFQNGSGVASNSAKAAEWFLKAANRSEEHTSELQSRRDLVCRLLLEKKKNILLSTSP